MSCKYIDYNGRCLMYTGCIEMPGVNDDGICICNDDEDPSYLCSDYKPI